MSKSWNQERCTERRTCCCRAKLRLSRLCKDEGACWEAAILNAPCASINGPCCPCSSVTARCM